MKAKKITYTIIFTLISLGGIYFYFELFRASSMDNFKCASSFSTRANNTVISGLIKYTFISGHGEVAADFNLQIADKEPERINRVFNFTYTREGNIYTMVSEGFYDQAHFGTLKNMIPDFYIIDNSGLRLKIYKQSRHGYVLEHENISLLYCAES